METVREFSGMLCISAVGCCVLKMLLPESTLEPVLKAILSAFFLLCLLLPLRSLNLDMPDAAMLASASESETSGLTEVYHEQLVRAAKDNISRVIAVRMERMGIQMKEGELRVNVHTDMDGCIEIESIEVFLDEGHAADASGIETLITQELELPCQIVIPGEE